LQNQTQPLGKRNTYGRFRSPVAKNRRSLLVNLLKGRHRTAETKRKRGQKGKKKRKKRKEKKEQKEKERGRPDIIFPPGFFLHAGKGGSRNPVPRWGRGGCIRARRFFPGVAAARGNPPAGKKTRQSWLKKTYRPWERLGAGGPCCWEMWFGQRDGSTGSERGGQFDKNLIFMEKEARGA